MSSLVLVAITHDHAAIDLLERVALDAESSRALAALLAATPGAAEAVVLSTCNRTELYLAGPAPVAAVARGALAAHTGVSFSALSDAAVTLTDEAASLHLFRVACGLESRVVGEGEILGQVRGAASRAIAEGTAGGHLAALFRFAAAAGRRSRRANSASDQPSLASIAVESAGPGVAGGTLVVGSGALASALAAELGRRRLDYLVCARRRERAAALARRPHDALALDGLVGALDHVDVVVCATAARAPLLRGDDVAAAMARRGGRPLTIIDLSMPRNVDPAARGAGVRIVDLEGLTADGGELQRRRAAYAVNTEHERYRAWLAGRAAGPAIVRLRTDVHEKCLAAARRSLAGALEEPTIEREARRIAAELLHGPTVALKELVALGNIEGATALLADYGIDAQSEGLFVPADGPLAAAS